MNKEEIKECLSKYNITKYTIHDNLVVDVHRYVSLNGQNLTSLPFQFGIVQGHFSCSNNKLTSLDHCPKEVHGNFYCCGNKLTSLEHCPKVIKGMFWCDGYLHTDIRYLRYSLAKKLMKL